MNIVFNRGTVVELASLPANSIALDGYVQGPALDVEGRRFSFDHHAGCLRLVTKATCQQVAEAIRLGLPVDEKTTVFVNDVDADTVTACWLLENPEAVFRPEVVEFVDAIGRTDAHGPLFTPHPIHAQLNPPPAWKKDAPPQSLEMLRQKMAFIDDFFAGHTFPAQKPDDEPSEGWGWNARRGWFPVQSLDGFKSFYAQGAVLGFLGGKLPNGTWQYTVAKASDLVAADLGPGSKVRPMTSINQVEDTILGVLAMAEQEKNPAQSLAHTWGGGSSIGGSPRNPDGSGSRLTPEEVLAVFKQFA